MDSRSAGNASRSVLSLLVMIAGGLLLLSMPAVLLVLALAHPQDAHLPGMLVILSSVGGMALVAIGATLHE